MIYLAAAVVPALVLMNYVYKQDKRNKEPIGLLGMCILMGVCAALASIALEGIGISALNMSQIDQTTPLYIMALAFGVVAVVEEGTKLFFLYLKTWKNPNFDYKFDGIIYAVFVSLGFAAFENIKYVFSYGLSVALPRAILAIPGHMTFAVVMGVFYGRAKYLENHGQPGKWLYIFLGWFFAVLLHRTHQARVQPGLQTELTTSKEPCFRRALCLIANVFQLFDLEHLFWYNIY